MKNIKLGQTLNNLRRQLTGTTEDHSTLMDIAQLSLVKSRVDHLAGWATVWYTHDNYFVRQTIRGREYWYKVEGTDLVMLNEADSRRIEKWYVDATT